MTAPTKDELRAAFHEHTPEGVFDPMDWLLEVVDAVWSREDMVERVAVELDREIPLLLERVLMPRMIAFANEHPEAPRAT